MPILKHIRHDHTAWRELRKDVAKSFGVPPNGFSVSNPVGSKNSFQANFDLAFAHLKQAGLVVQERRPKPANPRKLQAVISLTPDGIQVLMSGGTVEFPETTAKRDLAKEASKASRRVKTPKKKATTAAVPKPRRANILGAEKSIIEGIPTASLERLFALWVQNVQRVGDQEQRFKHEAAKRIIVAVEKEWERRLPYIRLNPDHFKWPSTEADRGTGGFEIGNAPDVGMLAYMEYRVGRTNGQPVGVRRAILDRVVEGTLPLYGGIQYYDQWGKPNSAARLQKLAEAIAAFTRNAKRRGKVRLADAISEWEADLEYLYKTYYLPRFGFGWPSP